MKGGGNDSHTKGGKNDKNKNNCNKSIIFATKLRYDKSDVRYNKWRYCHISGR